MLELLGFTQWNKNLLTKENFSLTLDWPLIRKHKTLVFYRTIKQCSLSQVGRIWGVNTFSLRNQSSYPISETS